MDNLINLEMLFWAAENGGRPEYAEIARSHADTTMKYNFRPAGTEIDYAIIYADYYYIEALLRLKNKKI